MNLIVKAYYLFAVPLHPKEKLKSYHKSWSEYFAETLSNDVKGITHAAVTVEAKCNICKKFNFKTFHFGTTGKKDDYGVFTKIIKLVEC